MIESELEAWIVLAPHPVHPTKVAIIEAMRWIDQPLSPSDLAQAFDGAVSLPVVSYHLASLARAGLGCVDGGSGFEAAACH